jgi:hypothetical protein
MAARYWHIPFLRNPDRIDIDKLGLRVMREERRQRVRDILSAFFGGFNAMLSERDARRAGARCEAFPALLRPFAQEGAAMAFSIRSFFSFKYSARDFEPLSDQLGRQYFFMHYIGAGFWCGMAWRRWPARVVRISERFHPFYRYLCFDGFGFETGLFNYLKHPNALDVFSRFTGFARQACYQGFGRSLWFLYMDDPASLRRQISMIDRAYRGDCYSGVGLAVLFTHLDAPAVALNYSEHVDALYLSDYFLGISLALYARRMMNPDYLDECLQKLSPVRSDFLRSLLDICDLHFDQLADCPAINHYRDWREAVAADIAAMLHRSAAASSRR